MSIKVLIVNLYIYIYIPYMRTDALSPYWNSDYLMYVCGLKVIT